MASRVWRAMLALKITQIKRYLLAEAKCAIIRTMPVAKGPSQETSGSVLYLRNTPPDLARKLRAAAALSGKRFPGYVQEVLQAHVTDLERKGLLPKPK